MKKFRFVDISENGRYIFETPGINPAICYVSELKFAEVGYNLTIQIDWAVNGKYSKGMRKKMLRRGINSMLRRFVHEHKHKHLKD